MMMYILTPLCKRSWAFATTEPYQINQRALLTANEANRFMCRVILAHLSDLQIHYGGEAKPREGERRIAARTLHTLHYKVLLLLLLLLPTFSADQ